MKHRQISINTKLSYILLLILFNFIIFILVLKTDNYGKAVLFQNVSSSNKELFFNFIQIVLFYFVFYFIFKNYLSKIDHNIRIKITSNFIDYLMLVIILFNYLIYFLFDVGKAGTTNSSIGFLIKIFPLSHLTYFYYGIIRKKITKFNILILVSSIILSILKGWSGVVVYIFLLEIFHRKEFINLKNAIFYLVLFPIVIKLYQYLNIFKFYIRSGSIFSISYIETLEQVINRLSLFSNFSYIKEIRTEFVRIIGAENMFIYIYEFIFSIIPNRFIGIYNYRPLDNIFTINFISSKLESSGFALSLPGLYTLTSSINWSNIIFFTLFLFVIFNFWFLISRFYWTYDIKNLLFLYLFSFIYSGNLRGLGIRIYSAFLFLALIIIGELLANKKLFLKKRGIK